MPTRTPKHLREAMKLVEEMGCPGTWVEKARHHVYQSPEGTPILTLSQSSAGPKKRGTPSLLRLNIQRYMRQHG